MITGMAKQPVTLYVVPNCPLCEDVRAWLRTNNVEFTERDVANEYPALRRMYKLTKQGLVPVIEVGDRTFIRPDADTLSNYFSSSN
jgi:glutaredoxin 3